MKEPISITVSASREKVFRLLADADQQPRWMDGLVEAKYDGALALGTRFRHGLREGSRIAVYEGEVRQFTSPIRFAYVVHHPYFSIEVDYLLTDVSGQTRVDYRCAYRPKTFIGRFLGLCFSWMPARLARRHLARLKAAAETGNPTP